MTPILTAVLSLVCLLPAGAAAGDTAGDTELRVFNTPHYRIHTDLPRELSDDLATRLDAMYDEYARRLSDFARPDPSTPLEVYLVHTQERYLHFAGLALAGTGGSFNATRRLLAAFLDGPGRDSLRRTLQHEAFHQFAAQTIGENLPVWLNEGLAQIFEEGIWSGQGFLLGQVPPLRLRQLHHDIDSGNLIDFSRILSMTHKQWAANWRDPAAAATQYNQAWAMTQFLVYDSDDAGRPKYRARMIRMLKLLHDGLDPQSAFNSAFSSNIDGFHDRFLEFAARLQPTPQATLIENQGILADMLMEMTRRGRSYNAFDDFRADSIAQGWRIHYRRGNVQWESAPDPSVYFCAPGGFGFNPDSQHFEMAAGRPLADLVCHCNGLPPLRTRFIEVNGKIEHETLVGVQD